MPSLDPGDLWLELFVKHYQDGLLNHEGLRYQRHRLLRAFFMGLPALGRLVYDGRRNLGLKTYDWWKCTTCGVIFPVIYGHIRCNHVNISICPWCRHDSTPGRFGA